MPTLRSICSAEDTVASKRVNSWITSQAVTDAWNVTVRVWFSDQRQLVSVKNALRFPSLNHLFRVDSCIRAASAPISTRLLGDQIQHSDKIAVLSGGLYFLHTWMLASWGRFQ